MIIELICLPLLALAKLIIGLIPAIEYIPNSVSDTISLLVKAMQFFPEDVWVLAIGNIVFWITVQLIWSVIKFVLGLIPFLNIGGN